MQIFRDYNRRELRSRRIFRPPRERELICRGGDWDQVCAGSNSPIITDRSRFVSRREERKKGKKRVQLERNSYRRFVTIGHRWKKFIPGGDRVEGSRWRERITRALECARLQRGVSKMSRRE